MLHYHCTYRELGFPKAGLQQVSFEEGLEVMGPDSLLVSELSMAGDWQAPEEKPELLTRPRFPYNILECGKLEEVSRLSPFPGEIAGALDFIGKVGDNYLLLGRSAGTSTQAVGDFYVFDTKERSISHRYSLSVPWWRSGEIWLENDKLGIF